MNIDKDILFMLGKPLPVDGVGQIRFMTYEEQLLHLSELSVMKMNVLHIYYETRKTISESDIESLKEIESIKESDILTLATSNRVFSDAYLKVFSLVLDNYSEEERMDILERVFDNNELFSKLRAKVLEMQILHEDEVSPNFEIQQGIEMGRKSKGNGGEKTSPMDIVSAIVAGTSNSFEQVCKMTVFQVYSIYYRYGAIKRYDTDVLFATVSNEIDISSWSKNIDLFDSGNGNSINKADFDKKFSKMMK